MLPSQGQLKQFGKLRNTGGGGSVGLQNQCTKMMFVSYQSKVHIYACTVVCICRAVIVTQFLKLFCRQYSYCTSCLERLSVGVRDVNTFFALLHVVLS